MAHERKLTFIQSLIAGGAAGTAVDFLFFPIDTVKTRLQSAQGFARAGGFSGIYKGVGSIAVGSAPGAAVFFSTYDTMKKNLPIQGSFNHIVSASVGEVAACLVRVPTEVIKTRAQTSSYGALAQSSWAAAKLVWTYEGLSGFYRGFGITVMREIPFASLQFSLYEYLKYRLALYLSPRREYKQLYPHEAAVCGSIAGGVSAALTTPLDVLKTRVMLDLKNPNSPSPPNISLLARLHLIYTMEGGIGALFAGVVPRTMWISAGGAVFLGMYELVIDNLST